MEIAIFAFSLVIPDGFIQNAILSSTEWSLTEKTRITKTKLDLPPCSSKGYVCRTASIFSEQPERPGIQRNGLHTKCLFLQKRCCAFSGMKRLSQQEGAVINQDKPQDRQRVLLQERSRPVLG